MDSCCDDIGREKGDTMRFLFIIFLGAFLTGCVAESQKGLEFIYTFGPELLSQLAQVLGVLTMVATGIARITPTPKDDEYVRGVSKAIWDVIDFFPTVGVNKRTNQIKRNYNYNRKGFKSEVK